MKTKIIYSDKCLGYGQWHVEGPERVRRAADFLRAQDYQIIAPEPAAEEDIVKAHDTDYVWSVKKSLVSDPDTPAYDNIYQVACLSAGGAILAAETNGFSLMRPPGHHVGTNGAALGAYTRGFCYLNNIAIAVKHVAKPTLILDIDGHHGNGTQEIFLKDSNVTFVSLHRHPNYPGTGLTSEANCHNFPLPADCGNPEYLEVLDSALAQVKAARYDVIAVSAGFDTHKGDLASLALTEDGYREIGKRIAALEKPTFFVLEGGYNGENNGRDIDHLLQGFEHRKS